MYGVMLSELYSPNIPVIFEKCGFEFFIVDCEHGYFEYNQVASMAAVSTNRKIDMLVRVPRLSREYFNKYLDMGVTGLLVPMVSSVSEATEAIKYAKYAPVGKRGISVTRAHTEYNGTCFSKYMKEANRRTKLYIQIETKEAVSNVSKIASLKGIDGLIIGPNDLSYDIGNYGVYDSDEFKYLLKQVADAAINNNIVPGIISADKKLIEICKLMGYSFICEGSEIRMMLKYSKGRD